MKDIGRPSARQLLIAAAVLVLLTGGATVPGLFSFDNITQMLRQISVTGIIALGVTFVVIAGRLDLTVGSLLSLCAVVAITLHDEISPVAAVTVPIIIGLVVGCINGFLVAILRLNSLIATLGMLSVLQAVALVWTSGQNALIDRPEATWFAVIGRGYLLDVPIPVLIFLLLAALTAILLGMTRFGREVFSVGGNEIASRFSSIAARQVLFTCYMISGTLTGMAAIVFSSRVMAAQNNSGSGLELQVLSAVILGGTSLAGGDGGIGRTIIGVVLLGFIQNALLLIGLPYYVQWLVSWVVIIGVVWADVASRRGRVLA
ncbi:MULTISPECIES: ABC transporter permease [Mesorhizobium]|uniref:Monosaccharide ABC transporter membrane protein (CUT2 family) n=1 Tax=Rhizobium loti TaxID=381 RepID=A0A8E2WGZ0_RHILI|nr:MULTISPECIES: ABC transporter permease [Mesorhizobium]PWJ93782.1 monosaccharide ABC transporter membrane protein (CUT2 family) [Mesorhizobium loti]QKC82154.1 ABC transporter permease [Mesorhizobium sp. NZP2077]QKD15626.1 ABC transporter permease [Mesorhizobium sp. NZP2077]